MSMFPAQKEVRALDVMVDTYTKNPNFGDVKKFQNEINAARTKLKLLESELLGLRSGLSLVMNGLEDAGSRSPSLARSTLTRSKMSIGSSVTSDLSQVRSMDSPSDLSGVRIDSPSDLSGARMDSDSPNHSKEEDYEEFPRDSDPGDIEIAVPPPPPPMPLPPAAGQTNQFAEAQYDYDDPDDTTLSIVAGDRFLIIEADNDGWTKVRRIADGAEGFVPSSYIEIEHL